MSDISRRLRSFDTFMCCKPRLVEVAGRSFSVADPRVWNMLPASLLLCMYVCMYVDLYRATLTAYAVTRRV